MAEKWNLNQMPMQSGKRFLITGANSGLGYGTAKALAKSGAEVIMTARSLDKGNTALESIKREVPNAKLKLMMLDLADLNSVKGFVDKYEDELGAIDVLINNAGVMLPQSRKTTQQGFELQFGTNHLGHFAFTKYLLPFLEKATNPRVVTLSSLVAKMRPAKIYWDDMQWERSYDDMAAYSQSKLANMMFGLELNDLLVNRGSNISSLLAHPGYTATNLQQHMGLQGKIMNFLLAQNVEMGILPTLRAATDPNAKSGEYYGPNRMNEWRGYPTISTPNDLAMEKLQRKRLWERSEKLTGVRY
ncbi:oxidoreductase [Aureibacter tunicatorum]|uniref:NAD(P)-dependent dehydrogenase (Short-subunit alcohol dehydrogenase family) n=1 Tax=Aureibacter tunicatorum TaxID=866807 RepID=A0AAE4BRF9_9BACT|nr:oxidoreductase [Aureibacter tunicatorum]MDR6237745.1 NAD(P)-dependent dehydrogenase (short-subunit alcohol dehydrogenase family) [Aureibacter tunicatorum]BDD02780.1 short-chain dehydrogenase [Aureibacter tunicatorum]